MKHEGLVFGKFYPFHLGHAALIDFALPHCRRLHVVVCVAASETIPAEVREAWIRAHCQPEQGVEVHLMHYDENELPNTSVSSREVSRLWAAKFKADLPGLTAVFTSEPYGDYLAEYMGIAHLAFDRGRDLVPVSGTAIREMPLQHWEYLPKPVQQYYTLRIAVVGTESTGKTVLTEVLARHFETAFVREMGREVIPQSKGTRLPDLYDVIEAQAALIRETLPKAHKLLFMDTGLPTTRSYARYLFGQELVLPEEKEHAMRADLYLLLEADASYVQDGTRLDKVDRDGLALALEEEMKGLNVVRVGGSDWDERTARAIAVVEEYLGRF